MLIGIVVLLPYVTGCSLFPRTQADAQPNSPGSKQGETSTAVEVAIAKTELLEKPVEYTGKTEPVQKVDLRSRIEGRLLKLNVDVGDPVRKGQILAQLDDTLLLTSVKEAQAELAALQSEVARAKAQVGNAQATAEQARLELEQAKVDAARLQTLWKAGAISKQEAELAQTTAATAQQNFQAAIKQINTEQQAVAAAEGRVKAQQAIVAQNQERQSYALLASPINGVVLSRIEPGNLITPGNEVLKLGDFSSVKVIVNVTDSKLADIQPGESVTMRLDALPNDFFPGKVTKILPLAPQGGLQVPVEVTIPNNNNLIGRGLLARISFTPTTQPRVVIPATALEASGEREGGGEGERGSNSNLQSGTVFVVIDEGTETQVKARSVQLGDRTNDKIEILSGLKPGERFVTRSGAPLKDGDRIRLSI
ncbi:MAG TPA: efflux transporter periplasmic adaptor subunit [Cyanobacteria bacterium UBA11162]|nr:efflux transporter periplasmic adaptor subunit [Cyanobacteria bacterium UBA11162]